jgi:Cu-processing system permease protein
LLAALSWGVFSLEENSSKGVLTLLNLILLNVPLVSIVFSTIYIYNSSEFIELLLSQPIKRSKIWISLFAGLQLSLLASFLIGAGIPLLLFAEPDVSWIMICTGIFISAIFVSIAFFGAIQTRDKAKGIGVSILLWLYFALLFDGLVLFLIFQFSEYPIEIPMMVLSAFSPIDISRMLVLLHLDVSAMMGYTGAVYREFFGTASGMLVALLVLLLWVALPFLFSLRKFRTKDL